MSLERVDSHRRIAVAALVGFAAGAMFAMVTGCRSCPTCPVAVAPPPVTIAVPTQPCALPELPAAFDFRPIEIDTGTARITKSEISLLAAYRLAIAQWIAAAQECIARGKGATP